MVKKRVHEIAKELKIESKDLIKKLVDLGIKVKCNFSTLDDEEVIKVREALSAEIPKTTKKSAGTKAAATETAPADGGARKAEVSAEVNSPAAALKPETKENQPGAEDKAEPKTVKPERTQSLSKFGPGLVDKVPQRPPDRRFAERPLAFEKKASRGIFSGITAPAPQQEAKVTPEERPDLIASADHEAAPFPEETRDLKETAVKPIPKESTEPGNQPQAPSPPKAKAPDPRFESRGGQGKPSAPRPWEGRRPDSRVPTQGHGAISGQRPAQGPGRRPSPGTGARPAPGTGGRPAPGGRPNHAGPRQPSFGHSAPRPDGRHTGYGERKAPYPASDTRPPKLAPIPPPPQTDKNKSSQKQEQRPKTDKKVKDKTADRLVPLREEEGEKLRGKLLKRRGKAESQPVLVRPAERKPVQIGETITVKDLAEKMQRKAADLIKKLMALGMFVTINQEIDSDTAVILAQEFGYQVEVKPEFDIESLLVEEPENDPEKCKPRSPIVTVMGHVDHGKTSLLDSIRKTHVTATEAGGITQHIGAYQVEKNSRKITFIDTPGHEAFTAMRARGANVTDVVVLVVAADDGVMPQTVEAINHARAAGVPIVVALNKMDKENAKPDRVKKELADQGLVPEEWAGDTVCVPVSALKNQGIEDLLEMILLVSDVLELKANPDCPARGTIVESKLDKGRGPVATVLVQNGTLKVGDTLVTGGHFARVRAMIDDKSKRVNHIGPSTPVEVLGFSEVPEAGEPFVVIDEHLARQIVQKRIAKKREDEAKARAKMALEDVYARIKEGQIKELPLIVKADVQGSAEALSKALERLGTEEVRVNLIHTGVGAITETDIMLASAAGAIIIGFNVRPDVNARKAQEREKIDTRLYQVIYEAINDVKAALSGLLEPDYREVILGRAEVRKVFHASKVGTIAGCYVTEGKVSRDAGVRVVRGGVVVHTGKIDSLKRFKDDVRDVAQGFECGLMVENFNDLEEGDELEFYTVEAVKRHLE
ncbi:MAG: translation initiation factor IF-2 [Bacillota bacterium]